MATNNAVNVRLPTGYVSDLIISYASTTTISMTTGSARNSTDVYNINITSTKTISVSSTGINALDTGAVAANTWYAVFVIGDTTGTNTGQGLLSLSSTSPSLPSGYNVFRRIGWIKTNSSSEILNFYQSGSDKSRIYTWNDLVSILTVLSNGLATGFTTVSCAAFVPSTSNVVQLTCYFNADGNADSFYLKTTGSSLTVATTPYRFSPGVKSAGGGLYRISVQLVTNSSRQIDYAQDSAADGLTLIVIGYTDYV